MTLQPDPTDAPTSRRGTSLTVAADAKLREIIANGAFAPGDRLPPEHELTARIGVSRSVLREAVAGLRAEGLLTSRRGSGVFVAAPQPRGPFSIPIDDIAAVPGIVQLLELRAAVEIEAAGLGAVRRSTAQAERITEALARMDGESRTYLSAQLDFDYHRRIAEATGNPNFARFMDFIGGYVIPRQRVRIEVDPAAGRDAYVKMLQREHRDIEQAIWASDEIAARDAMRQHLVGSARRYQRWAEEAEKAKTGATAP